MTRPAERPFLIEGAEYITIVDGAGHYIDLPSLTTTERDALSADNGMMIYNSTTSQIEAYQNGAWGALGGGGSSGDVTGPASSTDNAIARFDGTTGKTLQDTAHVTISDDGVIISDVATGTAPLSISSTTVVANLNADKLDGKDETAFLLTDGSRALTGDLQTGANAILATELTTGPTAPATSKWKLYFMADGLYHMDDGGTVTGPLGTSGTPAGSDGQIQYNNGGVFGGDSDLFWDDTNKRLGIKQSSPQNGLSLGQGLNFSIDMSAPTGVSATANAGGSLADGTYYYRVTALDGTGETVGSAEVNATTSGTDNSVSISWSAVTGAAKYRVYGRSSGAQDQYWETTSTSLIDDGTAGTSGTVPTTTTAYVSKIVASGDSEFRSGGLSLLGDIDSNQHGLYNLKFLAGDSGTKPSYVFASAFASGSNTGGIKEAVEYLENNRTSTAPGGVVLLTEEIYDIYETIVISKSGIRITSLSPRGSTLRGQFSSSEFMIEVGDGASVVKDVMLDNFFMVDGGTSSGIRLRAAWFCTVSVSINNLGGTALKLEAISGLNGCFWNYFPNFRAYACGRGIWLVGTSDYGCNQNVFEGGLSHGAGGGDVGIRLEGNVGSNVFYGTGVEEWGVYNVQLTGNSDGAPADNFFNGARLENATDNQVNITSTGSDCARNIFKNCLVLGTATDKSAYYINQGSNTLISGGRVSGQSDAAGTITVTTAASHTHIEDVDNYSLSDSGTATLENRTGTESADAEEPQGAWPKGAVVDFTDSGDGSGNGVYLKLQDGSWSKIGT